MISLVLALAAAAALDLSPRPPGAAGVEHDRQRTRCAACHTAEGWDRVAFDHARTGFPLEGAHRTAACRGCHVATDFKAGVPRACGACHRDVHGGRLGARCADCHDAVAWGEPTFGPEAHRRTNFPLDGRHAVLPCEECHGDRRDRGFSRPTRTCAECHQADLAAGVAGPFTHEDWGFTGDCRRCHGAWDFGGALYPGHDACFPINSGNHSGVRCLRCHTSLNPSMQTGACADQATPSTGTADCYRCHGCAEPGEHQDVSGWRCPDPSYSLDCWRCHPNGSEGD